MWQPTNIYFRSYSVLVAASMLITFISIFLKCGTGHFTAQDTLHTSFTLAYNIEYLTYSPEILHR